MRLRRSLPVVVVVSALAAGPLALGAPSGTPTQRKCSSLAPCPVSRAQLVTQVADPGPARAGSPCAAVAASDGWWAWPCLESGASRARPFCKTGQRSTPLHPCLRAVPVCKPEQVSTTIKPCIRARAATPVVVRTRRKR